MAPNVPRAYIIHVPRDVDKRGRTAMLMTLEDLTGPITRTAGISSIWT